jgi:alkanesulfonate monooxygenase SsuD/methylene tetrahydromethanopterin reductase-like flavin-dependent oxidoreductase (luciferase family)
MERGDTAPETAQDRLASAPRRVRVGISLGFQNPPQWRLPWPRLYEETLAFVEAAEHLGFDDVWLSEHHFVDDGYCPSLLTVSGALAARTRRMRIGTKVLLLPFHDPVRLAEDVAVADVLSDGRFDLGVGAGYRFEEFEGFALSRSERGARMDEGLVVLRQALTGEPFEHRGTFFRYGRVQIVPPPVQQPVPIWLGGRSAGAMRRAAKYGCHLQLADFILANAVADYQAYTAALSGAGRDPRAYFVEAISTLFVDEDRERAWQIAAPHLLYQQNQYQQWFSAAGDRPTDHFTPMKDLGDLPEGSYLVGDPETVIAHIRTLYSHVPFTHLAFWTLLPGMPLGQALRSLELTARYILPVLHDLPQGMGRERSEKELSHVSGNHAG